MELSNEDMLRLNVLLTQDVHAIRINHSTMTLHALTAQGEAKVSLNPTGRSDQYLKQVQQLLSTHVLGSPGGYPVYLKRWTRMGQQRGDNLDKLLLLGEPEAVVAVVHSPGLTTETAKRAWWAFEDAEHARKMLARSCIAEDELGKVLAAYLLEFLPFEERHSAMIESIRLMLQPGLLSDKQVAEIWKRAKRRNTFYVGFLQSRPGDLPMPSLAHPNEDEIKQRLSALAESNSTARHLLYMLSQPGQAWLKTVSATLKKPNDQDVVVALVDLIGYYFSEIRIDEQLRRDINQISNDAALATSADAPANTEIDAILESTPETQPLLESMIFLSMLSEQIVAPIFGLTDAIGSLMRRKIEPVTTPTLTHLDRLQGKA